MKKVFNREIKRIFSRPIYLVATFGTLLFSMIFFSTFMQQGLPKKMPMATIDLDQSSLSREYVKNLNATQQADVIMHLGSYTEARKELQKGTIYGFVLIDKGFEKSAISGEQPKITLYVNDAYLVAGSLLLKNGTYLNELTAGGLKREILRKKGVPESKIMGTLQPITVDNHMLGNPWVSYAVYLINMVLFGIFQLVILMMTLFSIGSELKYKTSREWLASANDNIFVALVGKLLPYTIIYCVIGLGINLFLYYMLHFPLHSSIFYMLLATLLYILAYQSIGVFIIGVVPVLRDGVAMVAFYGLLALTLAGFTFPIEQMASNVQIFSQLFPIRHYFRIYANQALLGSPIEYSAVHYVALVLFLVLPFFVAIRLKNAAIKQNFPTH